MKKVLGNFDFKKLVETCRHLPVSPEDREKQRRSFAFGNANIENPSVTKEIVAMAADRLLAFSELTTSEILNGILLNIGETRFTDQDFCRFLKTIDLDDRFKIIHKDSGLYSTSVYVALSFSLMSLALQDWSDHYELRDTMRAAMRRDLEERGVLPKYEELFKTLAKQFVESLKK